MKQLLIVTSLLFCGAFALAQAAGVDPSAITPPTEAEISAFLAALGGTTALKGLALVAVIAQGVALLLRTGLGDLAGKYRLLIIVLVNVVGGFVTLKMSGSDTTSALLHPTMLAALQVLANQVYRQFFVKED